MTEWARLRWPRFWVVMTAAAVVCAGDLMVTCLVHGRDLLASACFVLGALFLVSTARWIWSGSLEERKGEVYRGMYVKAAEDVERMARNVRGMDSKLTIARARIAELEKDQAARREGTAPNSREAERLAWLVEELGEAARTAARVLLHGWDGANGRNGMTNRVRLEREMGDVRAAVNAMIDVGDVGLPAVQGWQRKKREQYERRQG